MLIELQIKDFAIIDKLHLEVSSGLNIISGETGAGKSVLVKSLGLLMGVKTDSHDVRTGSDEAVVQGSFDISKRDDVKKRLQKLSIACDEGQLIVKRIISSQGKSKVYLNGEMCTLNDLREIVSPLIELAENDAPLIEMTGQHDTKHLLSKGYHIELLDQYCGILSERKAYREIFQDIQKLKGDISAFTSNANTQFQQLEYFKFQLEQIEVLDMVPGDEENLVSKIKMAKNSEKIIHFYQTMEDSVSQAGSLFQNLKKEGLKFSEYGEIAGHLETINDITLKIEEFSYDLSKSSLQLNLDFDLEEAEKKLSTLRKLQKLFGNSIEEIISAREKLKVDINNIENFEQELAQLHKKLASLQIQAKQLAENLHEKRLKSAKDLEKAVNRELDDLNMKGLIFHIQVDKHTELSSTGISNVEFFTQTSKQDEKKPLLKYASGGELSRILLSLKSVIQQSPNARTYLFDEVDTGISGETAQKVGKKLKKIAKGQQVLCVTHLPQVACQGDQHYLIQKINHKNKVELKMKKLSSEERIEELARLISGEKITKTSRDHAKELLAEAH